MPIKTYDPRKPVVRKNRKAETSTGAKDTQVVGAGVIILPFPPSANRYWRSRVMMMHGKPVVSTYVSTEAQQYKMAVNRLMLGFAPVSGELIVSIDFYRPRKSGDLDNRIKVLIDSLIGITWEDDNQIVEIHARRFDDKRDPRVEVIIEPAVIL